MPSRAEYVSLLKENNLTPAQVAPIVRPDRLEKARAAIAAAERQKISPQEREMLARMRDALPQNANSLAEQLQHDFVETLTRLGVPHPEEVFVGVYPTRVFNACALRRGHGFLVLLDDGLFEVIEAAATLMIDWRGQADAPRRLGTIVERYCLRHELPDPLELSDRAGEFGGISPSQRSERYAIGVAVTNFCEEFVLAHEYGHLTRGHLQGGKQSILRALGGDIQVVKKSLAQEHEADHWACHIISRNELGGRYGGRKEPNQLARLSTFGGPFVFLGLAALIEEFTRRDRGEGYMQDDPTHPPALERILRIWTYLGMMDVSNQLDLGKRFLELADQTSYELFGEGLKLDLNLWPRVAMNLPFRLTSRVEDAIKRGDNLDLEFRLLDDFVTAAYRQGHIAPGTAVGTSVEPGKTVGVPGMGVFQSPAGEDDLLNLFEGVCAGVEDEVFG
jgi:hypothetical protein